MPDGLDDARLLLPGVRLEQLELLGGSDRSEVRRVRAMWPDGSEHALIVKSFVSAGEGWVRESAALSVATTGAPTAHLVADGGEPPTVIMADLGRGATVADALLGSEPGIAADAVALWAETIATLHRSSLGSRDHFRAALAARAGDLPVSESTMSDAVDYAAGLLDDRCIQLDVVVPPGAMAELRGLPRRLNASGTSALSPNDACPDNNVRVGDGLVLIDFEGAQWRHIAWDVAYLTVPWPSCWCSWRLPDEVAERAIEQYCRTIEDEVPYVRTPEFRRDVALAGVGWALISTSWFLSAALAGDAPPKDPAIHTPTRRAMILHRLASARYSTELPALAQLAERLGDALAAVWGDVPLAYAPAFATSQ